MASQNLRALERSRKVAEKKKRPAGTRKSGVGGRSSIAGNRASLASSGGADDDDVFGDFNTTVFANREGPLKKTR